VRKRAADGLVNLYAVVWAIGYCYFGNPIKQWYRRHQHDADYFTHMGWLVGFAMAVIMIIWGVAQ